MCRGGLERCRCVGEYCKLCKVAVLNGRGNDGGYYWFSALERQRDGKLRRWLPSPGA
jgi:hypothetical protein